MDQEHKVKIDDACRAAEEFTNLYYENLDRRRHLMSKFYLDTGVMVWNGNGVNGKDMIHKLFMELPASESNLLSVDSHPILGKTNCIYVTGNDFRFLQLIPVHLDAAVGNQRTVLIQAAGFVTFQGKAGVPFQQNFMVTAEGDKWKIVSDCFRFQEVVQMPAESKAKF
ncbi:hypothetical protein J437_LFUL002685 [Ladona fulva]|uniref:NTF2 domain-containing protein n=1 Tax=Ladona fulva TaxID=123851 RepID=A0A8K0JXF9_LADFU|nr:hypothetical protein J437_LFUL002685 [Ladona fulva]